MNKYALLIGINYLDTKYQLPGCINDIYEISDKIKKFNYLEKNIVRMTDLSLFKPEKNIIMNKLEHIAESLEDKDYFLLYFSGHGKKEGIFTLDQKIIKIEKILNLFSNKDYSKIRLFFDCCYKGRCLMRFCTSFSTKPKLFTVNNSNTCVHEEHEVLDNDIFLFVSSSDKEKSVSGFIKNKKCEISLFTYYLIISLSNPSIKNKTYLYIIKNITKKFKKINFLQKPSIAYCQKNYLHNIIDI